MFVLKDSEMELGLGIHGEPGCERCSIRSAEEIVDEILQKLTSSKKLQIKKWEKLVVFLNNLGSTSQIEMNILAGEVVQWLAVNGYHNIARFVIGTGMTSIDGHGFSVTILRVLEDEWERAFGEFINILYERICTSSDYHSSVSRRLTFLNPKVTQSLSLPSPPADEPDERSVPSMGAPIYPETASKFRTSLKSAAFALKSKEQDLNDLDTCGDADCGTTWKTASEAILNQINEGKIDFKHPQTALLQIAHIFEKSVGGTTGAVS